ncbi:hypothetical protein [Undibacterium umbellatum]|uniref:Uncharacterized protein n=1 Tax=Undibacterium umbellatum TaxID=2762300 RepID=A0ABR6ZBY2_9BURK|nr:hypothetical protein [Undibacterium umbellatum]MBC3909188.1 hypothetical protein [Undibacterium umbellatum]
MIVAKHRILQVFAITYAPGKANAARFDEVARLLGIDAETVEVIVNENVGVQ